MPLLNHTTPSNSTLLHIVSSRVESEKSYSIQAVKYAYQKISIYRQGRYYFIPISSIQFLKADGSYTHIKLEDGRSFTSSKTLKQIALEVDHANFIRCHHSYIVNEKHIGKLDTKDFKINIGNHVIPISRSSRRKTLNRLHTTNLMVN